MVAVAGGDARCVSICRVEVVSGSDEEALEEIANTYEIVVQAGVHKASSIKVAEAAKIIENTQRDVNIALMNELSIIFDMMNINTFEVLEAAGTKWNFLKFQPGLVGGHCIGVDPYYLTHKAQKLGYHSQVILAGTLVTFDLPLEGVLLIIGVDELMDMARTTVNLVGNCLATAVVARWEGEFRREPLPGGP